MSGRRPGGAREAGLQATNSGGRRGVVRVHSRSDLKSVCGACSTRARLRTGRCSAKAKRPRTTRSELATNNAPSADEPVAPGAGSGTVVLRCMERGEPPALRALAAKQNEETKNGRSLLAPPRALPPSLQRTGATKDENSGGMRNRHGRWRCDPVYSVRSASIGSTRMARRAGTRQAKVATTAKNAATAEKMTGSKGST